MNKNTRNKAAKAEASADERQFYSIDGDDIRVTHPDGSVAIVTGEPRPLPRKLWRHAIKAGCQTTDSKPLPKVELNTDDDAFTRMGAIKAAMLDALEASDDDPDYAEAFTGAGVPNVRWLEKKVGFPLSADERDQAWAEVSAESSGEGDDENEGEDAE
ncbi:MAG TPA: hypothetical protein VGK41_01140 [Solirubrobacterales bacterium]